jgi:hypothetical protein
MSPSANLALCRRRWNVLRVLRSLLFVVILLPTVCAGATQVGTVITALGTVSAKIAGDDVRILGRNDAVFVGDVVTTGARSAAVVRLEDGSRISVRPDSTVSVDDYSEEPSQEKASVNLVRGGLRAVTGFISKRNPGSFRVTTPVATMGIRGTEFDARLCQKDCATEERGRTGKRGDVTLVMARVAFVGGKGTVEKADGTRTPMSMGSVVRNGDTLVTEADSYAILAFRDGTRVTVQAESRFRVDSYQYDVRRPKESEAQFNLLQGGLRLLTGAIGKVRPDSFKVRAAAATIGIRGTGFDMHHENPLAVFVWEGAVVLVYPGGTLVINEGETYLLPDEESAPVLLGAFPEKYTGTGPRPDSPEVDRLVDLFELFGTVERPEYLPGLFVFVRDGEVDLIQNGEILHLAAGEIGFADDSRMDRLSTVPGFILDDVFSPGLEEDGNDLLQQIEQEFIRELDEREDGLICEM